MAPATFFRLSFLAILLGSTIHSTAKARPLDSKRSSSSSSLVSRLKLDDESSNCWDSLIQLQSCTGELIMFFLNGETYLSHGCCQAIRAITQQCWPTMIDTLGFTTEETNVLQGYCDHEPSPAPISPMSATKARPLLDTEAKLVARLKLEGDNESSHCWGSLMQLQACTGEAILFFLNGETYLGHACCEAIRTIGHQCWPGMLQTLGFTTEEGDILQGYCDHDDKTAHNQPPPSPRLSHQGRQFLDNLVP